MSSCVRRNYAALSHLASLKGSKFNRVLKSVCDQDLTKAICECSWNVLHGRVDISPTRLSKLKRYKNKLRALADKSIPLSRKKALVQKGGFILPLLTAVLPALASLLFAKR